MMHDISEAFKAGCRQRKAEMQNRPEALNRMDSQHLKASSSLSSGIFMRNRIGL